MRKDRCSSGTAALRWAPDPRETPSLGGAPERLEDPLSGWGAEVREGCLARAVLGAETWDGHRATALQGHPLGRLRPSLDL